MSDSRQGTTLADLKGEIAAAVSLGAGALVATGYGITAARLHNVHVPAIPALGALPTTYYLGEALQASVVPLVLLLTIGAGWVALFGDGARGGEGGDRRHLPAALRKLLRPLARRFLYWPDLTLLIMFVSWAIDVFVVRGGMHGGGTEYAAALVGVTIIVCLVAWGGAWLVFAGKEPADTPRRRRENLIRTILLVAVIAVVGTSVIRVVNAYFLPNTLPAAVVSADPENCTFLGPAVNTERHCYFRGYYFGESGSWVFLVWKPTAEWVEAGKLETEERLKAEVVGESRREKDLESDLARLKVFGEHNRLILIPKDDVLQIAVAGELTDLP